MNRIILTTGGTGGHIFPALAVAEELRQRGAKLLFVGSEFGSEARLAKQAGIDFCGLPVRGVLGRGMRSVGAACALLRAVFQARSVVADFRPDVVAGFGAYASFAPLMAARLRGVPLAIHEQNAMPGMTNRLLSRLASRVFLSLPDTTGAFQASKCLLTGNPVRQSIVALGSSGQEDFSGRRLLVMGGSQGARAINSVILASLERLMAAGIQIRHQTGTGDLDRVRAGYAAHGFDVSGVTPFIDDVAGAYAWADLVLCRAGATSVAELAVAGKPSVLIPFPYATHDHQTCNARVMMEQGASVLVPESTIGQNDVGGLLVELLQDSARLKTMSVQARACARPDAAAQVAQGILDLCSKTRG